MAARILVLDCMADGKHELAKISKQGLSRRKHRHALQTAYVHGSVMQHGILLMLLLYLTEEHRQDPEQSEAVGGKAAA